MASKKKPDPDQQGFLSKALNMLAYPIASITTLWTARVNISDAAYDQIKRFDGFLVKPENVNDHDFINTLKAEDLPANVDLTLADKTAKLKEYPDIRKANVGEEKKIFRQAIVNIENSVDNEKLAENFAEARTKAFAESIAKRKDGLKLNTIRKEWKIMNRSQKQSTIINAVTIGAVSLGAMLAAANMKVITHGFARKDDEQNPTPPSL